MTDRIPSPRPPERPPPFRFPFVACLAPVVVSVALWAITGSMFALLFAVLGPVTAVASVVDSRFGARSLRRRETARFTADLAGVRDEIARRHERERALLLDRVPAAAEITARGGAGARRWSSAPAELSVALGTGEVPSRVRLEPGDDPELALLASAAALLPNAPVVVPGSLGSIGFVGPPALAASAARAVAVQLAWALSPAGHWCSIEEAWGSELPHRRGPRRPGFAAEFGVAGEHAPTIGVAHAESASRLPGECRVVVALQPSGSTIIAHPDPERRTPVRAGLVSREAARAWAVRVASDAARDGLTPPEALVPGSVALGPLLAADAAPTGLACAFVAGAAGPVQLDLVEHGPHAVVGGTTGSGKSELLISWVCAMAAARSPEQVTFLLVDFKGGAAFGPLADLPHTVGVITDLDEAEAARALASLRAELRHRERRLASAGVRDIADVEGLPRLVIVVDEFAAMLTEHPDLHALFADIASRGRSLGVHLVLCTQRPAGVVRDGVLANADLRLSLRVNNRADSSAVIGTDDAAHLPASTRGAAIVSLATADPLRVQVALASPTDLHVVASRWRDSPAPRRPWCPPLPAHIPASEAEGGFGLCDVPDEQRRQVATWSPDVDGHVMVLGASRSGVSTTLAALAPGAVRVPTGVAAAWDRLSALRECRDTVLVVDDLDSLLQRFGSEHREAAVDLLTEALRDGPSRGLHLAIGAQRLTSTVQVLAALVPSRLLLRHATKQDWLMSLGEPSQFSAQLPPGGGYWKGLRVQVAVGASPLRHDDDPVTVQLDDRPLAIVSARPAATAERLRAVGYAVMGLAELDPARLRGRAAVIGDVDDWQSRWGVLPGLRGAAAVVLESCTLADFRSITRSRQVPPPLDGLEGVGWLLDEAGGARRVRLPGQASASASSV